MSATLPEALRPIAWYERMYMQEPRRFAYPTTTEQAAWNTWRDNFRARLHEKLGLPGERTSLSVQYFATTQHDGYQRTYVEFESAPGVIVPAWLLVPTGQDGPAPGVIAVHGHGAGVDEVVGLGPDGTEYVDPQGYHQAFAVTLCKRGLVVLAPEMRAFGRRREAQAQAVGAEANSCREAAWWGIMLGKPLLGTRVWDTLRALDLLQSLPQVDPQRIGIMGGSGGGTVSLFAAALEQRFKAIVISNYFCTFRASILAVDHCDCNYVPGILQDAEMYDIAALIAPRPLLIVTGAQDEIFPLPGVLEAYEHLQAVYRALGANERLAKDVFAGGHQMKADTAGDFLGARLA